MLACQGFWHLLEMCEDRGTSEPLCRTLLRDDGGKSVSICGGSVVVQKYFSDLYYTGIIDGELISIPAS